METKPPTLDKMTPAELRHAFQALTERLDQIEAEITALRDGLAAAASQPQPAPAR
jgi:cell division protein FtsB